MMNEHILQYIWSKKLFSNLEFRCTKGFPIEVLDFGKWNYDQGPDFSLAKIKYQNTTFVGNIEIHIKSSDWYLHQHEKSNHYDSLILHVVYFDDCDIESLEQKNIPCLELKNYVSESVLNKLINLNDNPFDFIACEKLIKPNDIPLFFAEQKLLEKLERKRQFFFERLKNTQNNKEQVLLEQLAYGFGLKVNSELFSEMISYLGFNILNKTRANQTSLEALLLGTSGLLNITENIDEQTKIWQREYHFLVSKFKLSGLKFNPKFSKMRPPNFPTIRLSQLSVLIHQEVHIFSKIISSKSIEDFYSILEKVKSSEYWETHYQISKQTKEHSTVLSKDFIDLIILNVFLPIKYYFTEDEDINDQIIDFYKNLKHEKNQIIDHWKDLQIPINSALESQAFLQHYRDNCIEKKCLNCGVGFKILKHD
ncbi:DUF2851 family protein [Soonwooa sp.]|uniref:DUF2851 family protein n=1 Tax=Soonwooa sp. TaxID=1938592 RepID=UPI0028A83D0E|nr:DUF2851 family protein [Soonwooa sp.]